MIIIETCSQQTTLYNGHLLKQFKTIPKILVNTTNTFVTPKDIKNCQGDVYLHVEIVFYDHWHL